MFKIIIKTQERRQRRRSGVFTVNFEHISHLCLVLLLLTLNKWMLAGKLALALFNCFHQEIRLGD